ncbi:hypothetical protein OAA76_01520 [Planktotalea frisia]|nr:hypothetical protein [Planktotalea frisia]
MRDDRNKWDELRGVDDIIDTNGAMVSTVSCPRQTLISGVNVLQQTGPVIGWPDIATSRTYSLSVRRDRVLIVGGDFREDGWHQDLGQAVSDASGAYTVLEISGPNAFELLKRGTELSLKIPSRSVARLAFGVGVFLYRHTNETTFRLHVASAQCQTMWQSLETNLESLECVS